MTRTRCCWRWRRSLATLCATSAGRSTRTRCSPRWSRCRRWRRRSCATRRLSRCARSARRCPTATSWSTSCPPSRGWPRGSGSRRGSPPRSCLPPRTRAPAAPGRRSCAASLGSSATMRRRWCAAQPRPTWGSCRRWWRRSSSAASCSPSSLTSPKTIKILCACWRWSAAGPSRACSPATPACRMCCQSCSASYRTSPGA
mmetsp:Transcript_7606/g.19572  ORF Transcript_7606/g.19572 Transcript_7606/m.19572 type:complete len:200 (+) Transcript_7606:341-940(+)